MEIKQMKKVNTAQVCDPAILTGQAATMMNKAQKVD